MGQLLPRVQLNPRLYAGSSRAVHLQYELESIEVTGVKVEDVGLLSG